jgi:hypothetical protein
MKGHAAMAPHFYTVAEANAVLPEVRRLVKMMLDARHEVVELQPQLWPVVEKAVHNGGGKTVSQATRQIMQIQDMLATLDDLGIQVKDLNTGLIDFPAHKDGRTVLLCWLYDEPSVQFWHEVDTGFAGRQRIVDWE